MKDYKLFIASKSESIYIKKYNDYINQVITKKGNGKRPLVELTINNIYIDQELIDELQIALNRAKKDAKELNNEIN